MLRHHLLLFLRNIKRNKSTFLINLTGLSTGLACVLLIYLWVANEQGMDAFHEKDDRLHQVMVGYPDDQGVVTEDNLPFPLVGALTVEMPEVEYAVPVGSVHYPINGILSLGDQGIKCNGLFVGKDYFHAFSYNLLHGNKDHVLADKNGIALSEGLAIKLFGTAENILGRAIDLKSPGLDGTFHVSDIFMDPPPSSTAQFDVLLNFEVLLESDRWANGWNATPAEIYLVLKKGADLDHFNGKIESFLETRNPSEKSTLFLRQYSKKYLYGPYENGRPKKVRLAYVRVFALVGLFILLIACINFINLSTAQASRKMKEVGVKKVIGASRKQLILQFMGQSALMSALSIILALALVVLLLPRFNEITGKALELHIGIEVILSIVCIALFTGFVSGIYPAFYLSGFKPSAVLKGHRNTVNREPWVRKGLVIFQFALSVVFIVVVLIVNKQIEFILTKDLGYARENIVRFKMNKKYGYDHETFMSELKEIPGVVNATNISGGSIVENSGEGSGFSWKGQTSEQNAIYPRPHIGYGFFETLGIELIEGRVFSRDRSDEVSKLIVNEAAAEMIGSKDIIGKTVMDGDTRKQIIGVVENFNIKSLRNRMEPCFIRFLPSGSDVMVKLAAGQENATIGKLREFYKEFHPGYPFEFSFLDDEYQALYVSETKVALLLKYLTGLAILISCMGLFGLATFTAMRRKKEIGIRKVFGQTSAQVTAMLSGEFAKLVLISILIALPVAYLLVNNWLSGFAYRIPLQAWYFLGAGAIALIVAMSTVGGQTLLAANKNPVSALREE